MSYETGRGHLQACLCEALTWLAGFSISPFKAHLVAIDHSGTYCAIVVYQARTLAGNCAVTYAFEICSERR